MKLNQINTCLKVLAIEATGLVYDRYEPAYNIIFICSLSASLYQ